MLLSREQLREQLRRREIAPVYTLFGEETFLRDAAVKYIADLCFADGALRDFNEDEFSLNAPDEIRAALAAAEQLPMMAPRRVIRVTDLRVGATSNRDSLKEEFEEPLAAYLADPSASTVLIFVADELAAGRKIGKLLREKTAAVDFSRLDEGGLRNHAARRFKKLGVDAGPATVRHLVETVGPDVRRLNNEAAKLSAAALPDGVVTSEMIDALVPNSRELSNFSVTNNLIAGRRRQALRDLKKLLDDGTEPLSLLGLVSSTFRRHLNGQSRIDPERLVKALRRISETDVAIKTSLGGGGPTGARIQLEMLVCELALL